MLKIQELVLGTSFLAKVSKRTSDEDYETFHITYTKNNTNY
jgi:hypothetical protein